MTNPVAEFERAFAEYVGAEYAIALCNGTATLHTALAALGAKAGDPVAVPPLTMSATTIAVLHAGATPVFVDVDPDTWLMGENAYSIIGGQYWSVSVSLYGLHWQTLSSVDDAAQTLRSHHNCGVHFTSYSFQTSKILALGEGGMLVTNKEDLAVKAREFSSLGYRMRADQPRIDSRVIRDPSYDRHHTLGWNYRMAPEIAKVGVSWLSASDNPKVVGSVSDGSRHLGSRAELHLYKRRKAAAVYRDAIEGCPWITSQHVPDGWQHDYWTYAVALESAELWHPFVDAIERNGGERPYAAWKLTYQEPAFRHLAEDGTCPVAEDLQPRLVQFQTNKLDSARQNADAVAQAIKEIGG